MVALFAYLFSIAVFVGGGYAGLYALSHPDEFHQQAGPVKHIKREAKRTPEPAIAPSTAAAKSAHEPPVIEPEKQSASAEKQMVPAGADASTPDVSTSVATVAPATDVAAANASSEPAANTGSAEPSKIISPSAPDAAAIAAVDDVPGAIDSKSLAAVQEAHAEVKETSNSLPGKTDITGDTATPPPVPAHEPESDAAVKKEKTDRPARRQLTRSTQRTHTARAQRKLVKMVMRTIEFPDGHREVRLISPGRAGSMSAYESDSDDLF